MKTSLTTTLAAGLLVPALMAPAASASSVLLNTSLGDIVIDLLEEEAPLTVENFLGYVERGDYDGTIFHRSVSDFIVQGGAFEPGDGDAAPTQRETQDPVTNEPGVSNTRGTVALAKLGGDPSSGTNQFFFNLADNSGGGAALDTQNGGFTVFARVIEGLDIVDAIAALNTVNGGGAFEDLPYQGATVPTGFDEVDYVLINSASVVPVIIDPVDPVVPDPIDPVDPVLPTDPAAVPSPSALAAGLLGLGAMVARRRRR